MRALNELTGNILEGGSSAHSWLVEGRSPSAREKLISGMIAELGCHSLDVVRMQMSGKASYKAEDANAFIERLDMGAYGNYLVGIIDDGDALSETVQNKLLKTIEEPRASVLIFVGTSNTDHLLATVRSRCGIIRTSDYIPESEDDRNAAGEMRAAAALMTGTGSAFHEFRDAIDKCVKTRADALMLIDVLEDGLRAELRGGGDIAAAADAIELAEKARMDIMRDMDRSKALKRLGLELSGLNK